jgi:hypothetical protein
MEINRKEGTKNRPTEKLETKIFLSLLQKLHSSISLDSIMINLFQHTAHFQWKAALGPFVYLRFLMPRNQDAVRRPELNEF